MCPTLIVDPCDVLLRQSKISYWIAGLLYFTGLLKIFLPLPHTNNAQKRQWPIFLSKGQINWFFGHGFNNFVRESRLITRLLWFLITLHPLQLHLKRSLNTLLSVLGIWARTGTVVKILIASDHTAGQTAEFWLKRNQAWLGRPVQWSTRFTYEHIACYEELVEILHPFPELILLGF